MTSPPHNNTIAPLDLPTTSYHQHDLSAPLQTTLSAREAERLPQDVIAVEPLEGNGGAANGTAVPVGDEKHPSIVGDGEDLRRHVTRTYAEGGFRAWSVVFGSWCGMTASFGFMNTLGLFQEQLTRDQLHMYSESAVGWIFGMHVFLAFFCGLQIGPVFDAKGPTWLILAGSILMVAATLLMGISTEYWHFMMTIGVLAGIGSSLILTPAIGSIGHFFLRRRALATGIGASGGACGGIFFPLLIRALLPKIGWGWATRVMALIMLGLCIVSIALVRAIIIPGEASGQGWRSMLPDMRILRKKSFALTTAGVFFLEWGLFIPLTYIASFAATVHATPTLSDAVALIPILNAGSALGRAVPGFFADKLGRFNAMILLLCLCGVSVLGLWLPAVILAATPNHSAVALRGITTTFAFLFGFASGANISLTPVCVGQLCRTHEYGRYYATCYTIVSFGSLTGIPIAGELLSACGGGYVGVVVFTGASYVLSVLAFSAARVVEVGGGVKNANGGWLAF